MGGLYPLRQCGVALVAEQRHPGVFHPPGMAPTCNLTAWCRTAARAPTRKREGVGKKEKGCLLIGQSVKGTPQESPQ